MQRFSELSRMILGLTPQALDNDNVTGPWIPFKHGGYLRAWLIGGAMAAAKTTKIELLQATDAAGSDVKAVKDQGDVAMAATITANTLVTEATVDLTAAAATDKVTVNGIVFTMAGATDASKREFADAAGLVTCVNHATYGVPGVSGSANGAVVTLVSDPIGETAITVVGTNVAGTVTVATVSAQAFVEIPAGLLDIHNGFYWVAAKVTSTATTVVGVVLDFYPSRWTPVQAVGAEDVA